MKLFLRVTLLSVFAIALIAPSASAIPAFARKYRMSCTTCHAPFPRLKAYGDDFAGNGFQLEDQEAPRYFVDTGDDALSLLRELPLAIRFDSWMFMADDGDNTRVDLRAPWVVKLISGGALSEHISYYFYFYLDEHGEVAGLDDAFLYFNNILPGQDLDIILGQFNLADPMLKAELRLTYEPYQAYKSRVGNSRIRLYYDRGVMAAYGMPWGSTTVTGMITNGNGIGPYEGGYADDDNNLAFSGHLAQDIGDKASIGLFGLAATEDDYGTQRSNDVTVFGVNGTVDIGPVQLNGQYVQRNDSNMMLFTPANELEHDLSGIIAEAIWWPNGDDSRFFMSLLYNRVEPEEGDGHLPVSLCDEYCAASESLEYETVTLHFGHLARTNIRVGLEGTYDVNTETFRAGVGVVAAF